ncbi:MAG TPA: glucosamine-6-phosphate deaminase [Victivallales bacterium]|nr:glucosamine-6-phosphate deaminase [Victivallales bacterium]HPO89953.1 glucosamine-6-phosphate deaminase [Victivallales bacterium]HRR05670.1 glucosamine-6-phosphate deaminase [Victivallales bacterium]HRR29412.1 glucosamine-6-phosphate deaminase [Victivallales bacterium]HRU01332.1 glucosamine-6-phosphate deaminase [Victivallales bacterium]
MKVIIKENRKEIGRLAAEEGAKIIKKAIADKGEANIIVATGASQFEMLEALVRFTDIRWDKVSAFHLDEYIGIDITHPASFRLYLWERFVSKLPLPLKYFYYIDGSKNPDQTIKEANETISKYKIDLAFIGIGENGHIAFNDPPADLETKSPYIIVNLDLACRRQQLGEGWFKTIEDVPEKAISMSINKILESKQIICTVPDERKAEAVYNTLYREVSPIYPSTSLKLHPNVSLYLDRYSASKIKDNYNIQ